MNKISLFIAISCTITFPVAATLVPVFEYRFPDSYSGGGPTLTDLSGAGNHGQIDGAGTGGYLSADRPPAFVTGGSLTGIGGGHGDTDAIDLLNNAAIAATGGFTMDTWFRWGGAYSDIRKLIDYAGTDNLRTNSSEIQFVLNNANLLSAPIVAGQWYHVRAEFDTQGNAVDGSGFISGEARLYLDGSLVNSVAATKTLYGDGLDRPIGINRWGGGGADYNQGAIYNPSLYLGIATIPEPTTGLLMITGLLLVMRRRVS